jgi:hypothetical protein
LAEDTIITSVVIFFAALVHGIVGFGYAQVVMGILPIFRDPGSSSVVFTITAVIVNFAIFWSVRKWFRLEDWLFPVAGLVFGLPAGIFIFKQLAGNEMKAAIAIVILISAIMMYYLRKSSRLKEMMERSEFSPGKKTGFAAGLIAGIFGGAVAIPGPPMILYGAFMTSTNRWEDQRTKAVFTAFFGTLMLYRLVALAITEDLTVPLITESAIAIPALGLGALAGITIFKKIPKEYFRLLVIGGLAITSIILLISSIF